MPMIDRDRLATLHREEESRFVDLHPRSAALAKDADGPLLAGVPMPWMTRWPGSFPLFVDTRRRRPAHRRRRTQLRRPLSRRHRCDDRARPPAVADAIADRARTGITTMLPTDDAIWVGRGAARRFGLPLWQFALSATDANRFVLRHARHVTGRPQDPRLRLVLPRHRRRDPRHPRRRPGASPARAASAPRSTRPPPRRRPVQRRRRARGRLAGATSPACSTEPALTNIGIVLPSRATTTRSARSPAGTATLLVIDETHTICAGPGGCTPRWDLDPDFFVIGKPIGGGCRRRRSG